MNNENYTIKPIRPERKFGDAVAEFMVTNPIMRSIGFGLQGPANANFNPFGYIARKMGIDTHPLQAQNGVERGIEKASQYGYDMAAMSTVGNLAKEAGLLGKGNSLKSRIAQNILAPDVIPATTAAVGGGFAEGVLDPQSWYGTMAANMLGGSPLETYNLAKSGLRKLPYIGNGIDNAMYKMERPWFVRNNPDLEIMDFTPSLEQLKSYPPQSKFNPNKNYTREEADALLRNRLARENMEICNDDFSYVPGAVEQRWGVQHLLGEDRRPFIRTTNNTLNNPDVKFTSEGKNFYGKLYKNSDSGKNFMDYIMTENGNIFDKYIVAPKRIIRETKKGIQDMSLNTQTVPGSGGVTYTQLPDSINNGNITLRPAVVNSNLKNISTISQGLNETQKTAFGKAFNQATSNTKGALGSLEHMNSFSKELAKDNSLGVVKNAVDEAIRAGKNSFEKSPVKNGFIPAIDNAVMHNQPQKWFTKEDYNTMSEEDEKKNMPLITSQILLEKEGKIPQYLTKGM